MPVALSVELQENMQMAGWLYWRIYETQFKRSDFKKRFGKEFDDVYGKYMKKLSFLGLSKDDGDHIVLTDRGAYWLHALEDIFSIDYISKLWGTSKQFIAGLALTNRCNLRCHHCRVTDLETKDLSFEETVNILDSFYKEGGRSVYLEGGEPFIWNDGKSGIEDIVEHAHNIGFLTVVIYTNGTIPIETSADTVFISVDGLKETHDALRGKTFDRIMENVRESAHPSMFINHTINNSNKDEIEEFCEHISKIDQIQGIFFYFHTPYYGHDDLYIDPDERNEIILKLLDYKRKYKILNSRAGFKSALKNDWKRPLDICRVFDKDGEYKCCRFYKDSELCKNCGYLSYAEIDQTLKLKPSAIFSATKYF